MSTSNSLNTRFGKSPMQNLSLIHKIFDRARNILDRNLRIDAMLIQKIDAVRPQSLQRVLNDELDMVGFAVQPRESLPCLLIDVPSVLRCDPNLITKRLYGLAEDPLVLPGPVR